MLPYFIIFLFGMTCSSTIYAQVYDYEVDLNQLKKDQLTITLNVPPLNQKELKFQMAAIVPGTYRMSDYGQLVSSFIAYDQEGNEMKVSHPSINVWLIKGATKLDKIVYRIHDTWEMNTFFESGGTNFYEDIFILNHGGCFGFFEGFADLSYQLKIQKPTHLYGGTALQRIAGDSNFDLFEAASYGELLDNPILYTKPDTASFRVDSTEYFIQLYSPTGKNNAPSLVEDLKAVVKAQNRYLGGRMPMERYCFLIYMAAEHSRKSPIPFGWNALEHTYSSFYCISEGDLNHLRAKLKDIAAHEFFHIWTPLTIRSNKIHDFDFMKPQMSKHLWLYEGATEYACFHSQVQNGTISVKRFLNYLSGKIWDMGRFDDNVPFTLVSEQCIKQMQSQYGNVYMKGAIINMCLDIKLRVLSNGEYGFQNMIVDLYKKYNRQQSFDDDELFDVISELSGYPKEIRAFFKDYVEGSKSLPLKELLDAVGIQFVYKGQLKELFAFGFEEEDLSYNSEQQKLELNAKCLNSFGINIMKFKEGDLLYKWQGQEIELRTIKKVWEEYKKTAKKNSELEVTVLRKNEAGVFEELDLKGNVVELTESVEKAFIPWKNISKETALIQKAWIGVR